MWFLPCNPRMKCKTVIVTPGIQRKKRNAEDPELTEHYTSWYICELLNLSVNISIDNLYFSKDWINTRCSNVIDIQGLLKYLSNVLVKAYAYKQEAVKEAEKHKDPVTRMCGGKGA